MRIKFKAGDPRAGTIAQMDSIRGQELVDAGAAVKVKDDGSDADATADAVSSTGEKSGIDTTTIATKTAAKTTAKAKK